MPQYHNLDDSGDPGLEGAEGSSSHFVLAMVQLPERAPLPELAEARRLLYLPPLFEFKYYSAKSRQKTVLFNTIQAIPFRVRAVALDKTVTAKEFAGKSGQDLTIELTARLVLRASEAEIAGDVLVIDGATPAFCRALRVRLSEECRQLGRARPFKKIVGSRSDREDGLQLADLIAGAIREHVMGDEGNYYQTFADKVVDLWRLPGGGK